MDILRLRQEYLLKNNKMSNGYNNNSNLVELPNQNTRDINLDELAKFISNKLSNIELIEDSLVEDICNKIKLLSESHNNKIKNWFDCKYEEDLKKLFEVNLKFNEMCIFYEKNCYITINEN